MSTDFNTDHSRGSASESSEESAPVNRSASEDSDTDASDADASDADTSDADASDADAFADGGLPKLVQSGPDALEDPERLEELRESFFRLEGFASQAQSPNTTRAYASDLEDFRHWAGRMGREWLPAEPETVALYLGARSDELSLATLERRLAAISSVHRDEGHEPPTSVTEPPLRKVWRGLVREKTRQQDGAPPLLIEELQMIIDNLPRYSSDEEGPTGDLTLTALRDRALLLVGWTGALRRSELVGLTTEDVEFIGGEGVNVYIRRSKTDQEAEGTVKGLPHGTGDTCPVASLRQWMNAAEKEVEGPFEGPIFRRFYRGESVGESAMTGQYVSTVLKRHAENAGLDPSQLSSHSLRAGFITQAIRAGKSERRVKEHSGHSSWEAFNRYVEEAGTFQNNPAENIGL